MINLVNINDFKSLEIITNPNWIYIGRWNQNFHASPLANPYKIDKYLTRAQSIALYRVWLWQQMQHDTKAFRELQRIQQLDLNSDVTLMCWCYPLSCHGDIIINAIEWMNKQKPHKIIL